MARFGFKAVDKVSGKTIRHIITDDEKELKAYARAVKKEFSPNEIEIILNDKGINEFSTEQEYKEYLEENKSKQVITFNFK